MDKRYWIITKDGGFLTGMDTLTAAKARADRATIDAIILGLDTRYTVKDTAPAGDCLKA